MLLPRSFDDAVKRFFFLHFLPCLYTYRLYLCAFFFLFFPLPALFHYRPQQTTTTLFNVHLHHNIHLTCIIYPISFANPTLSQKKYCYIFVKFQNLSSLVIMD